MNLIKRSGIIIAIILPLLILISIRNCSTRSFKYDAKKWSEPSFDGSNIISGPDLATIPGEKLIIYLDSSSYRAEEESISELNISPDSVLNRKYLHKIKNHKGPVIISSSDPALSARIWMVISQTGFRNLYILTGSYDNEVFKNEFRPDTMVRPEI
jgi:hypothetical protein